MRWPVSLSKSPSPCGCWPSCLFVNISLFRKQRDAYPSSGAFKSEAVEYYADAGEGHQGGGPHGRDLPVEAEEVGQARSEGNTYYIIDEGPEEVLADHRDGTLGEGDGIGDAAQVGAHERHLGHLHRYVGTLAHGDADIGSGEGLRVVDAVAHHRHMAAFMLQLSDEVLLVLREYL